MTDQRAEGTFEPDQKQGGHLRSAKRNYAQHPRDPWVSPDLVRRHLLRGGELITGPTGSGKSRSRRRQNNGGGPALEKIESINGMEPDAFAELTDFPELTAVDPQQSVRFETPDGPLSMRVVDLMTPIGRGQRGLIAAPPRTGKTVLLQQMAAGIAANHPDIYMMVLLIDERVEEVTDMRRRVHGEVVASSNDQNVASHVRIARLMIEKAKRMVETGEHVLILLDSLTRLGRAFNAATRGGGRVMSGGVSVGALNEPKAVFGSARNVENGGSLTIMATALIETGSRMDDVIFNEFKGTGNMEIMLCRDLANLRIWPAMDLNQSGTRKEELLLGSETAAKVHRIRRQIASQPNVKAMETLLAALEKHPTNEAFLDSLAS